MDKAAWIVLAVLLAYVGVIFLGGMTIWHVLIGAVFVIAAVVIVVKSRRGKPA